MRLRKELSKLRRSICEIFLIDRYSKPALFDIDDKLSAYLDFEEGFFIEAGANDGFIQSNTYYLEKIKKWKGILIEPIPDLFERCKINRPRSIVFNCALVPFDYKDQNISMIAANLMSLVKGARKSEQADLEHINKGVKIQEDVLSANTLSVPARTLTSILDEVRPGKIDFLSLDVEGYELNVLKGLDFTKHQPRFILIEANYYDEIHHFLVAKGYSFIDSLSEKDCLYRYI